ncbi:MAG: hypothetical protein QXQ38_00695 [Archaeoglobaceae archaeon]|nr:hypothetical protein [Archaeoglobales archaeon]
MKEVVRISQISIVRLEIKNPNKEIAGKAFQKLIELHSGVFTREVYDYYGKKQKVDFGMKIGNKTIGIRVTDKIEFLGDEFLLKSLFRGIMEEFNEIYAAISISEILRSFGYKVNTRKMEEGIYIEAER